MAEETESGYGSISIRDIKAILKTAQQYKKDIGKKLCAWDRITFEVVIKNNERLMVEGAKQCDLINMFYL
jgi:hypothetical protein